MMAAPTMPDKFKGKLKANCGYTDTMPRKWTQEEIDWILSLKQQGFSIRDIAESVGRSETSISIKMKRIGKTNQKYNRNHVAEKYRLNQMFLDEVKPDTILDLYCGTKSFYKGMNVTTNDIDKNIEADYHCDSFKLLCELYAQGKKYDLVDLDPFGSAYDCFDLAIKMARKGVVITLGELGHKRWKRIDFVKSHYGIESMDDFTFDALIEHIQMIGRRNKKELTIWAAREWQNIGRVWFTISDIKITGQWHGKETKQIEQTKPRCIDGEQIRFDLLR